MLTKEQFHEQWWPTSGAHAVYQSQLWSWKGRETDAYNIWKQASKGGAWGFEDSWNVFNAQQQAIEAARLQQEELARREAEAQEAARQLAAEQARQQAEFQAEQQRVSEQQRAEAAAVEAQLGAERAAAEQEQAALRSQFETERAATEQQIAQSRVETERQQLVAKKQATVATGVEKQLSFNKARQLQISTTAQQQQQTQKPKAKTSIGQPGVSSTRFSARPSIGGYGGTAPTRVSPTGLNI
jgi:hypothetical protein